MKKSITDEQRRYVEEHFASESNAELKAATGLSLPSIYRIADEAEVCRTRAFRRKLQGVLYDCVAHSSSEGIRRARLLGYQDV